MKWNWGTKLVLAMAAFMAMIIIFVVLMMREDIHLVEKSYYPKGLTFQEMIDKKGRGAAFDDSISVAVNSNLIVLSFPATIDPAGVSGSLHVYNRMEETGDRVFDLKADEDGEFVFPVDGLDGRYILKIDWKYGDKTYYNEKKVTISP